ncbi:MAG TPA: methyltransferase domain-containing protein, partial [Myxococcota bacterium]|nr:methyltransferase domain-containing protein [Myxococcota bacterium]
MSEPLAFTGERFVPGARGEIWLEHWHRYHFAARWAAGRRVLDVACGEGYGAAMLARVAAHVTGVDVSEPAIAHARSAYAQVGNAAFVAASCTRMPLPDASFDVAVSFETLEHIGEQEAFLDELARVLKPGGVLLLSSPNKAEYSDRRGFRNEFHVRELYREELARLVAARFPHLAWYGQRPSFFSVIAPAGAAAAAGELFEVAESEPGRGERAFAQPLYFVLAASTAAESIAALPPAVSVLADRDDWVHRDYEKVMADLVAAAARLQLAEKVIGERDALVASLQQDLGEWQRLKHDADRRLADLEAAKERMVAQLNGEIAARDAVVDAKQHEIDRRGGLRWWLKLPLHRFGLLK